MTIETVRVPDLGGAEEVEVIELTVALGDRVEMDQTLLVLESEKATMELPSPVAGVVSRILVAEGDKIEGEGDPLVEIEVTEATAAAEEPQGSAEPAEQEKPPASKAAAAVEESVTAKAAKKAPTSPPPSRDEAAEGGEDSAATAEKPSTDAQPSSADSAEGSGRDGAGSGIYAGPYVRRLARELGVALDEIEGSGPRRRILKEDVQSFVRRRLEAPVAAGAAIPVVPEIDYARFGPVSGGDLTRIGRFTAANMHRSWLNVPHVTQFDAADITELETFRGARRRDAEERGLKLTPVPFILKACAVALRDNPVLNRALGGDGASFVQREYVHLGMAVDTERGLLVPVIRDVDRKGIWELAAEIAEQAERARAGKLQVKDMQGACFTVTSLGAIGGQGFTPIINTPEVGILGVSRAGVQPVWNGSEFTPRTLLPLALSYDHRVVNGADGGRFLTQVVALLSEIRALLL